MPVVPALPFSTRRFAMKDKIRTLVDSQREEILTTLCDLIAINTVNPYAGGKILGSEKAGQDYLEPRCREIGLKTRRAEVRPNVYQEAGVLGPVPRDFSGRENLVAEMDFGGEGPHLLLFAHMDTVGVDSMSIPPFEPRRSDGRIYGRGASDDKSGITVAFHALKALLETGIPRCGRITFASVVDEECDGGGAGIMSLCLEGLKPDAAICLDGSSSFIARGCSGCATGRITVPGISAHAAGSGGVSALEKALVIKDALDAYGHRRAESTPDAPLTIGVFRAGQHPAMVPGSAEMLFNLVYHQREAEAAQSRGHGFTGGFLRRDLESVVQGAAARDPFLAENPPQTSWVKDLPPYCTGNDSPVLQRLRAVAEEIRGESVEVRIAPYWTDASIFALSTGRDVVNFGSGAGCAHSPDEYVEVETILRQTEILTCFLADVFRNGRPLLP